VGSRNERRRRRASGAVVSTLGAVVVIATLLVAQEVPATRTVWDGVYTEAQAKRGAVRYDEQCSACHGAEGAGGGLAPALTGAAFAANYDGQTVADLVERIRRTMPVGQEGTLDREQTADITAYLLQANGFPAGSAELPADAHALKSIKYVATKPSGR
jgi:mono/diheme cytochrome c family protein